MKKLLISVLTCSLVFIGGINASAATKTEQILSQMPGVTAEELEQSIKDTAVSTNMSEDEVQDQILMELKTQNELSAKENMRNMRKSRTSVSACSASDEDSEAIYTLDAAKNVGDIFYQPSSTAFVKHGHVGIYYTTDTIVEAMPDDGVRTLSRLNKKVQKGSKIFLLDGVEQNIRDNAANWAFSQVGCKYSYNFATNRKTSVTGDKNCSKLVWSSYKVAGNMDIDSNGGLGVYPNDILNYKLSNVYKTY